ESLDATGMGIHPESDAELLQAAVAQRQDLLADELGQLLVFFVLCDFRKVGRDVTDEDGVRLLTAIFELPPVEGQGPKAAVHHDATSPSPRLLQPRFGDEAAELVAERALGQAEVEDATTLRLG